MSLDRPADAPATNTIIEIGPGKGALTEELLAVAGRVIAIEIDPVLVHYLQQKFAERIAEGKLVVIEGDVLSTDWRTLPLSAESAPPLSADSTRPVIAGNLPYYITSPIVEKVLALGGGWEKAVFLVQAEVAARIAAEPGTRDYGYLSVMVQAQTGVEYLFDVSREAFRPSPKVDSAVIRLTPRAPKFDQAIAPAELDGFLRFAQLCFRQKRKTLRNNLAGAYGKEIVDGLPEARMRAEQLSISEFVALYERLPQNIGNG